MNNLNPTELKKYSGNIQEIVDAMTRQDAEKELISEICKQVKDKLGIDPKDTRKIAKLAYDRSLEEERQKSEDVFDLAEMVMKNL